MRKSLKLNRHKQKANYMRSRPKDNIRFGSTDIDKLNININICRALYKEKEISMFSSISPVKKIDDYENTADRMMDMRRRLSPVKISNKTNPRATLS